MRRPATSDQSNAPSRPSREPQPRSSLE
jgi:hypothetical protein